MSRNSFVLFSGGDYTYFGIKQGIVETLSRIEKNDYDKIEVSFNIDGLPVYKSRNLSVWPIQGAVTNIVDVACKPFVVALYKKTPRFRLFTRFC